MEDKSKRKLLKSDLEDIQNDIDETIRFNEGVRARIRASTVIIQKRKNQELKRERAKALLFFSLGLTVILLLLLAIALPNRALASQLDDYSIVEQYYTRACVTDQFEQTRRFLQATQAWGPGVVDEEVKRLRADEKVVNGRYRYCVRKFRRFYQLEILEPTEKELEDLQK